MHLLRVFEKLTVYTVNLAGYAHDGGETTAKTAAINI
jgi:hypothetical protein